MSRFAKLADKPKAVVETRAIAGKVVNSSAPPPSRVAQGDLRILLAGNVVGIAHLRAQEWDKPAGFDGGSI